MSFRLFVAFSLVFIFSSATSVSAEDYTGSEYTTNVEQKLARTRALVEERNQQRKERALTPSFEAPAPSGISGAKVIQSLLLCLGVFFVGIHIYKRLNKNRPNIFSGKRIRILEKQNLGPKTSLVLANVDGKEILLACGSEQVNFVDLDLSKAFDGLKNNAEEYQTDEAKQPAVIKLRDVCAAGR